MSLLLKKVNEKPDFFVSFHREEHVKHLVYPLETVLDDSIGCAIWFAARGKGAQFVLDNGKLVRKVEDYTSNAKVCGAWHLLSKGSYGPRVYSVVWEYHGVWKL